MTADLWRRSPLDTWALTLCETLGVPGANIIPTPLGAVVDLPGVDDVARIGAAFPEATIVATADEMSVAITTIFGEVVFRADMAPAVVPEQRGAR